MAELSTLRKFEALSPFEIKNELRSLAKEATKTTQSAFLDAGRGNPNWISTTPREGFFLLGQFAIIESKRVMDEAPGIGGMPKANGVAARLDTWLAMHQDMPGAPFLSEMVNSPSRPSNSMPMPSCTSLSTRSSATTIPFPTACSSITSKSCTST